MSRLRLSLGFAVAPLAASVVWYLSLIVREPTLALGETGTEFFGGLRAALVLTAPFTYVATLLVGGPAYYLLSRFGTLRAWHVYLLGGLTGMLLGSTMGQQLRLIDGLSGLCMGLAAATTFRLIVSGSPPNQRVKLPAPPLLR